MIVPIDDLHREVQGAVDAQGHPPALPRRSTKYKGKTWGFFDDGDVWNLYYRKDIFANAKLKAAYKAKFKRDLRVPRTWDEIAETSQFITDQLAPEGVRQRRGPRARQPGQLVLLLPDVPVARRASSSTRRR